MTPDFFFNLGASFFVTKTVFVTRIEMCPTKKTFWQSLIYLVFELSNCFLYSKTVFDDKIAVRIEMCPIKKTFWQYLIYLVFKFASWFFSCKIGSATFFLLFARGFTKCTFLMTNFFCAWHKREKENKKGPQEAFLTSINNKERFLIARARERWE